MKKLLVLVALFTTVYVNNAGAQQQGAGDPAVMLQRYKDQLKPELVEKAKITQAQAEKVVDISFSYRQKMRGLRDLPDADRKKQTEELKAAQIKEFLAIPLTEEQVKAVNGVFEERRKQMQERQNNGGGNGNG